MAYKVKDFYYQRAKKENFFARSVYKLEEIDKKFHILNKGDRVLDLGYFPGSWLQYTSVKIGPTGLAVGIDLKQKSKKLDNLYNVNTFQEDVFSIEGLSSIGIDSPFDVLLSDMAANTTGIKSVDQIRSLNLVEQVFGLLPTFLIEKGNLVMKAFEGDELQKYLKCMKKDFKEFRYLRPRSTRSVSKEFFVIGKGFRA